MPHLSQHFSIYSSNMTVMNILRTSLIVFLALDLRINTSIILGVAYLTGHQRWNETLSFHSRIYHHRMPVTFVMARQRRIFCLVLQVSTKKVKRNRLGCGYIITPILIKKLAGELNGHLKKRDCKSFIQMFRFELAEGRGGAFEY